MNNLKGETTVFIQSLIEQEKNYKKIFKELPFINLSLFIVFTISIFFIAPNLKSASIFFLPFIGILFVNSLVLIAYRYYQFKVFQSDLFYRNFMEHHRVIQDIYNNYQHDPEIKMIMEVLVVGCDINDKDDLKKIKKLSNKLSSEMIKYNRENNTSV